MIKKRKINTQVIRFEKKQQPKQTKVVLSEQLDKEIRQKNEEKITHTRPEEVVQVRSENKPDLNQDTHKHTLWKKQELPPRATKYEKKEKKATRFRLKAFAFLWACFFIWWARGSVVSFMKWGDINLKKGISLGTKSMISDVIWKEPIKDDNGNINFAILGYWGWWHAWWYLTDAIIVASVNLKAGTMSMVSIPRDLRVKKPNGLYWKINSVFESSFWKNDNDYDKSAPSILGKLEEITNIPLHYYAFIDFDWFEKFIDKIWWIEIDVPDPIYDPYYPGPNYSYTVFSIDSWLQTMDGPTALKYVRSRKTTSDYSRSLRQQLVINAIIEKFTNVKTLISPGKIEGLYGDITEFVHTNVSLDEALWMLPFASAIDHKSSRQIAECWWYRRETRQAWCLLYVPPMDQMGGASTQIPYGATPGNPSNYSVIHSYVNDTALNTNFLQEGAVVRVQNGLSTGVNKTIWNTPLANNIAVDFVKQWFTIFDIGNATGALEQTMIITNGPRKKRENAIQRVSRFLPETTIIQEGWEVPDGPSLTVVLGNDMVINWKVYKGDDDLPAYLTYN